MTVREDWWNVEAEPPWLDTEEYLEEWRRTPAQRRWLMEVPTYADDPGTDTAPGWPLPTRDMLEDEFVGVLSPQVRLLLDRYWAMMCQAAADHDIDEVFPPLTQESYAQDWEWSDPDRGPVWVVEMLVEVLGHFPWEPGAPVSSSEDLYREPMHFLRGYLEEILAGDRSGWEPAMVGIFFIADSQPQWLRKMATAGRVPRLTLPSWPIPLRAPWMAA